MSESTAEQEQKAVASRAPATRGPMGMGATESSQNFLASGKRLLGLLRPQRAPMIVVLAFTLASVVLTALGPRILANATDLVFAGWLGRQADSGVSAEQYVEGLRAQGQTERADIIAALPQFTPGQGIDVEAVGRVLLTVLALYVGAALLAWIQGRILAGVVQRTVFRLRKDVEATLHRLPLPYFDKQPRGEVLSRVTNDIDNMAQSLQQTLSQALTSLLTVVAMVVMMFTISPLLAAIALITIPLSAVITAVIGKRAQRHFRDQWANTGRVNGLVEESFSGHEVVKVFGRREQNERAFGKANDDLTRAGFSAQFISGLIMPMMMFLGNLNYVVVAIVGGLRVVSGTLTVGDVQAFIQYSRQFTQPLSQLASMANLVQSGVASAERVFEVLDADEQRPDPARPSRLHGAGSGRIVFEDVDFSYTPDRPLIRDLDLHVEPGQTIAIVGPSGAGKTTLVNLLLRFYEIDAGRITLDGVDIADLTRDDLRSRIGMVLQDTWLFQGTIAENIRYGRPDATDEEVREAARATYVDRFVHSLPDGYDTVLDADSGAVSAGEKQLLTIARAFLARPSLLILDEATSSVDTRTEVLLQQAMSALRADRTSFVIAHRLSTIRDADRILVMRDGDIVEQGTHDDLLKAGGVYAGLNQAQFSAAAVDVDAEAAVAVGAHAADAGTTSEVTAT